MIFVKKNVDEGKRSWDGSEVILGAKIGDYFPGIDGRQLYIIDCCPNCFMNKVMPLIEKTFGIKFRDMDMDDMRKSVESLGY